jgi:hypothetical protein
MSLAIYALTSSFSETQLGVIKGAGCNQDSTTIRCFPCSGVSTDSRNNGVTPQLICLQPAAAAIMQLA